MVRIVLLVPIYEYSFYVKRMITVQLMVQTVITVTDLTALPRFPRYRYFNGTTPFWEGKFLISSTHYSPAECHSYIWKVLPKACWTAALKNAASNAPFSYQSTTWSPTRNIEVDILVFFKPEAAGVGDGYVDFPTLACLWCGEKSNEIFKTATKVKVPIREYWQL